MVSRWPLNGNFLVTVMVTKLSLDNHCNIHCKSLLLDGGWTTKSPADGNKSLSLPKVSAHKKLSAVV